MNILFKISNPSKLQSLLSVQRVVKNCHQKLLFSRIPIEECNKKKALKIWLSYGALKQYSRFTHTSLLRLSKCLPKYHNWSISFKHLNNNWKQTSNYHHIFVQLHYPLKGKDHLKFTKTVNFKETTMVCFSFFLVPHFEWWGKGVEFYLSQEEQKTCCVS